MASKDCDAHQRSFFSTSPRLEDMVFRTSIKIRANRSDYSGYELWCAPKFENFCFCNIFMNPTLVFYCAVTCVVRSAVSALELLWFVVLLMRFTTLLFHWACVPCTFNAKQMLYSRGSLVRSQVWELCFTILEFCSWASCRSYFTEYVCQTRSVLTTQSKSCTHVKIVISK